MKEKKIVDFYAKLLIKRDQRIAELKILGIDESPDNLCDISINAGNTDKIIKRLKKLEKINLSFNKI